MNSGRHLLGVSFSGFDPTQTWTSRPSLTMPHIGSFELSAEDKRLPE